MNGYDEDDFLLLSGLQHLAYCERQWALIHLEMQWKENGRTVEGRIMHERVHDPASSSSSQRIISERGLAICSNRLGITGTADLVEFCSADDGIHIAGRMGKWRVVPIEYKRGKPKDKTDADEIQLCAQALCLEEMLDCQITYGYLFYDQIKHRVKITISQQLRDNVSHLAERMHDLYQIGQTPAAHKNISECRNCSMFDICNPHLSRNGNTSRYWHDILLDQIDEGSRL